MTDMDDIFDQVQAPSWAETLRSGNDIDDEEDTFFPQPEASDEIAAIEEVTVQMNQLTVENPPAEDPENLSRMAMFGNKRQVKRRSQIRKEQEAVKPAAAVPSRPAPRASSIPRPISRSSSITRAPSVTRTSNSSAPKTTAPSVPKHTGFRSGPVTRSQTRSVTSTTPAPVVVEHRSRDMGRNASKGNRSAQPSPTPNQVDFNQALTRRAGSFGDGVRTPLAAPRQPRAIQAPRPPSVTRVVRPTVTRPVPTATKPNPINRVRAPVTVTKSPKLAFGSTVRPKSQTTRKSVIQERTAASRPVPLRVSPSEATPAKGLTYPRTPQAARRASSVTRASAASVQSTPKTTERKVLKPRDIQGMVDRLSKPKASAVRPSTASTLKRTIPNTYTHGINTTRAIVRSRSNSRPPSQTSSVRDENVESLPTVQ